MYDARQVRYIIKTSCAVSERPSAVWENGLQTPLLIIYRVGWMTLGEDVERWMMNVNAFKRVSVAMPRFTVRWLIEALVGV